MPQPNQYPTLLPNSSEPTFDPLYPNGDRGAGGNTFTWRTSAEYTPVTAPFAMKMCTLKDTSGTYAYHKHASINWEYKAVIGFTGGQPPFKISFLQAPTGATIGGGVTQSMTRSLDAIGGGVYNFELPVHNNIIKWQPQAEDVGTTRTFEILIEDNYGQTLTNTHTVTVGESNFIYVDNNAADDTGAGTWAAPKKTFAIASSFANKICVYKTSGTYAVTFGGLNNSDNRARSHIALVDNVVFDMSTQQFGCSSAAQDLAFLNITFNGYVTSEANCRVFNLSGKVDRAVWWNCKWRNVELGSVANDNSGCIVFMSLGNPPTAVSSLPDSHAHTDICVMNCDIDETVKVQQLCTFGTRRVLAESNTGEMLPTYTTVGGNNNGTNWLHSKDGGNDVTFRFNVFSGGGVLTAPLLFSNQRAFYCSNLEALYNIIRWDQNEGISWNRQALVAGDVGQNIGAVNQHCIRNTFISNNGGTIEMLQWGPMMTGAEKVIYEGNIIATSHSTGINNQTGTDGYQSVGLNPKLATSAFDSSMKLTGASRVTYLGKQGAEIASTEPVGGTWLAQFNFNAGDTSSTVKSGVSFQNTQGIGTPVGQTEQGLEFTYSATTPDVDPANSEIRFTHPPASETWQKIRLFVPANFHHRQCVAVGVSGDISTWLVGDALVGADGTSEATIHSKSGGTIYLLFADNAYSDSAWVGTITNTTRSQSRTSTSRSVEADNNKLFTKWVDQYSASGAGPTIVWEFRASGDGGSILGQQYSAGAYSNTGAHGRDQLFANNLITPADFGTWMELIFHVKMSTARGVRDGVIGVYQKKSGASTFTKILEQTEADIGAPIEAVTPTQFSQGYFIGYSNSGYDVQTSLHVSEFWHSTTLPEELGSGGGGSAFTITGSGFGSKTTGVPAYDDWESASTGLVGSTIGQFNVSTTSATSITNSISHSGSKCLTHNFLTVDFPKLYREFSTRSRYARMSCWWRWTGSVTSSSVWKLLRFSTGDSDPYSDTNRFSAEYTGGAGADRPQTFSGITYIDNAIVEYSGLNEVADRMDLFTPDTWHFIEWEIDAGTVDGNNAVIRQKIDGVENIRYTNTPFLTTANPELIKYIMSPINGLDGATGRNVQYFMDESYTDGSLCHVVMTDNANYALSTNWAEQPIVSWSNTSIECTYNRGSFTIGSTAYRHVFNSSGTLVHSTTGFTVT